MGKSPNRRRFLISSASAVVMAQAPDGSVEPDDGRVGPTPALPRSRHSLIRTRGGFYLSTAARHRAADHSSVSYFSTNGFRRVMPSEYRLGFVSTRTNGKSGSLAEGHSRLSRQPVQMEYCRCRKGEPK